MASPSNDDVEPLAVPRRLAIAVSSGALAVAAVHLIWPGMEIDAVTLALLVVAVAPWLGPIFRTIELPGGWKFEFQEIQRQVDAVQRRVEDVEQLVFRGDTTPAMEERLSRAVQDFLTYFRAIDERLSVRAPSVAVRKGLHNAQYDGQRDEIQLDPEFAEDDYAVLREYAHHVLMTVGPEWNPAFLGLESGLADYFVASHNGHPGLGPALARHLRGQPGSGFDQQYVRNLENDRRLEDLDEYDAPQAEGEVWGAGFWELRQRLGQAEADHLLATAWIGKQWTNVRKGFARAVLDLIDDPHRAPAAEVFERRGLSA